MKLPSSFAVVALLLFVHSNYASAAVCDPRDFYSLDYSTYSAYERLVLFSSLSEEKLKEMETRHKGEMMIPFINVSAKGDSSYAQKVSSQLKRLLTIDQTLEAEATILRSRLDANGVEAYKACLKSSQAWISVAPADLYSEEATLILNWSSEKARVAGEVEDVKISNGAVVGDFRKTVPSDGASLIAVQRKDIFKPTTVSVLINGYPTQVTLPARIRNTLVFSPARFPDNKLVTASWHHNGYLDDRKSASYLSPADAEIVLGTAVVVDDAYANTLEKCTASTVNERTAILSCRAASPKKHVGVSAEAFGSVTLVRSVPIKM